MPWESEPCSCAHNATSAAISASGRGIPQSTKTSEASAASSAGATRSAPAVSRSLVAKAATFCIGAPSLRRRRAGEEGLGVAVKNLFVAVVRVAERAPVIDQPFVRQGRPVPAEHDAVLEAAADFFLQSRRKIFRRPAVHLVLHIGLVQQNRDHVVLPRPRRPAGQNLELRETRGDDVDVTRVAVLENDPHAARHALSDAGQSGHQQPRPPHIDRQLVERIPDRIAGRETKTVLTLAKTEEAGIARGKPRIFPQPKLPLGRIDRKPVAVNDIAIVAGEFRGAIVRGANLVVIGHPPGAVNIEDAADLALTKTLRHLRLGLERALALEDALSIGKLFRGAVMQPGAGGKMRMAIEIAHRIHFLS